MPLRIFRSRNVSGANVVQALLVAGMFGMFFMGALYMERVLGYDPLQIGLAFLPATLVMGDAVAALRGAADHALRRHADAAPRPGADRASGCCCSRGRRSTAATSQHVLPVMILLGFGIGVSFPALMTLAMSGATRRTPGLASGLVNTTAQVGGALGLAVLATLSTTRSDNLIADGESTASALTSGYHLAFLIGAALVVAASSSRSPCCSRRPRPPRAERQAEEHGASAIGRAARRAA